MTRSTWQLPTPISRLAVIPDGNSIVLAGGLTAAGTVSTVTRIDVTTGEATQSPALSEPVHDTAGVMLGGRPLVFGGGSATAGSAVQVPGAGVVGRLPQPRADLSATTLGTTAYVLCGYDGTNELTAVLATSNGRSFRPVANLVQTVRYAAVTSAAGAIWVFGGSHDGSTVNTIQRIDPTNGTAKVVGRLPAALSAASAVTIDGRILIAGGRTATGAVSSSVFEFNPATRSVRRVAQLRVPVANAATAVVGNRGYLIGGERGSPSGDLVATVQTLSIDRVAA